MDLVFDGLIRPQGNQLRANWRTVAAVWLFRLAGNSMTGGRSASGLRLEWFSLRNNESPPGVASGVPIAAPGLSCDYQRPPLAHVRVAEASRSSPLVREVSVQAFVLVRLGASLANWRRQQTVPSPGISGSRRSPGCRCFFRPSSTMNRRERGSLCPGTGSRAVRR